MAKLNIPSTMIGKAMAVSIAAALATSLSGCVGYDGDIYRGYVVDEKVVNQVKTGSSKEQTLVLLGTPSTTSTVGGDAWYYISQKAERKLAFMQPTVTDQRILAVYFDKNKKVQRIANYGLEDGRVINFNDRSTPTAGAESSFVKNMLQNLLRFS